MKTYDLTGTVRTELGKKATKATRIENNVPCVLYGNGKNTNFTATASDLRKLIYTPNVYVVNLTIDGKAYKAVVKELQFAPVSDKLLHIDFLEVTEKKPVTVELPLKLTGLAEGVKAGGKLSQEMRKLKVKGIYTDMPDEIVVDVTNLGVGKRIQISEITLDKLQLMNPKDAMVAQVKATRAAAAAAPAAGDAPAAK